MSTSKASHDHVILLLETPEFESPPTWLTKNFTIIEGGTHKGQTSRNKLIIFQDGTYIELFNFLSTSNQKVEFPDWYGKSTGLIDFAFTTTEATTSAKQNYEEITKRLTSVNNVDDDDQQQKKISYKKPLKGGRKRKDGKEIEWEITRPKFPEKKNITDSTIIDIPFFCHDLTSRNLRVPDDPSIFNHPSNATGIVGVDVLVPKEKLKFYLNMYKSILGVDHNIDGLFLLGVPSSGNNVIDRKKAFVKVNIPKNHYDENWLKNRGIGIRKIYISIDDDNNGENVDEETSLQDTGVGESLVLISQKKIKSILGTG